MSIWGPAILVVVAVGMALYSLDRHRPGPEAGRGRDPWRLGIFYCDPADRRLIVPKRSGLGRTLNYGRPTAWIFTFAPVLLVVVLKASGKH